MDIREFRLRLTDTNQTQLNSLLTQIIEGLLTIVLGIVAWFFLPDFPDQNRFLTPAQTAV